MILSNYEIDQHLTYNKEIHIACAKTRKAKKWKNTAITIEQFIKKISNTIRTNETVNEYLKLPKERQDEIKDVGAFVGGTLKGGLRRKEDVGWRHLLTFDIDYGDKNTIELIKEKLYGICFSIYSTHKHTPEHPRLRLIIYPDRPLLPDEYQAVVRSMANKIGINLFDPCSYETNRLMYWPSSPVDGEYVFYHSDEAFLDIGKVLDEYGPDDAWKITSLWPMSDVERTRIKDSAKKQGNPLEKKNIIGSFCRCISITEAIDKYLNDVYKKEKLKDRYTYLKGTTTGGLVIYDNVFAYSHHATDPTHGLCCNAFDLVRIHLFGGKDDSNETDTTKQPSYAEMCKFAMNIDAVRIDMINNKTQKPVTVDDFNDIPANAAKINDSITDNNAWKAQLQLTKEGAIKATWVNLAMIIRHDPEIPIRMCYNAFNQCVERENDGKIWRDADTAVIKEFIGRKYEINIATNQYEEVIDHIAHERTYHPVKDYIEGLTWDGVERIDSFFVRHLGIENNAYAREVSRCFFSAAVHRVFEPGTKFDYVIVLGGLQGIQKSEFVKILGRYKWYGVLSSFDPKIAMEEIGGKWIVEIEELAANNRQEIEQQKAFISAQSTRVRMAYARRSEEFRRQCVFVGTTNHLEYLKDTTGNRRWWPIDIVVDYIDTERLENEIDQIWAEAYATLYTCGYPTYFIDKKIEQYAQKLQKKKQEDEPLVGVINEWLNQPADPERYDAGHMLNDNDKHKFIKRYRVCVLEIWEDCLKEKGHPAYKDSRRIGDVMRQLDGWVKQESIRFGTRFGNQRGWVRKETDNMDDYEQIDS